MIAFVYEEGGQDLIEYTLLLAFVALLGMGLFIEVGAGTSVIWTHATNKLSNASLAAAGSGGS